MHCKMKKTSRDTCKCVSSKRTSYKKGKATKKKAAPKKKAGKKTRPHVFKIGDLTAAQRAKAVKNKLELEDLTPAQRAKVVKSIDYSQFAPGRKKKQQRGKGFANFLRGAADMYDKARLIAKEDTFFKK